MDNKLYQEKKIKETILLLDSYLEEVSQLNEYVSFCEPGEEYDIESKLDIAYNRFKSNFKKLYVLALAYLDANDSKELLKMFQKNFAKVLDVEFVGIETLNIEEEGTTYYVSSPLQEIKALFSVFEAFDGEHQNSIALIYLENILKSTQFIISEIGANPTSESSVYNSVKFVIKATFPSSIHPADSFIKTAKCYRPDILIPSLNTAIEYKFAESEARLTQTIEDINTDVKGYSQHSHYHLFYAVFYLKPGICTESRFHAIWDDYKFPNNWKPIVVFGQ